MILETLGFLGVSAPQKLLKYKKKKKKRISDKGISFIKKKYDLSNFRVQKKGCPHISKTLSGSQKERYEGAMHFTQESPRISSDERLKCI